MLRKAIMNPKIVVIGSNSFSGSDFIDLVLENKNFQVIGISRSKEKSAVFLPYKRHKNAKFKFYQLDLNKDLKDIIELLSKERPDYIVNFAAQSEVAPSWDNPEQWFETNVVGLSRLCKYLVKASYLRRYLHISSPEVYGTCKGIVKENAPLSPSTPYAASKAAADLYLYTLIKNFKFPAIFIRSTNVYGAHQQLFKIIPRSVIYIKMGKVIRLDGGGKAIKSYIHIRDVSRGELLALQKGKIGEIYHLSPMKGISVAQIVRLICQKMDTDFNKVTSVGKERLGQDEAYVIDSTKARNTMGWKPQISLEHGTLQVIDWINDNWNEIRLLPLEYIHKP